MSNETELRALQRLELEGRVAGSQVPRTVRNGNAFQQLLSAGILVEIRSGAGRVITVGKAESFTNFLNARYPGRGELREAEAIANVARYRNTKGGQKTAFRVVLLRGRGVIELNGHSYDLGRATDQFGCASCIMPRIRAERICVVENLDTFSIAEDLLGDRTFVHPYGRIGKHTLAGLETDDLLHFGDYDFTGLADFLRLKSAFPNARLYLPDNLEELWQAYSTPLKAKANAPDRVLGNTLPEVKRVLHLLADTGRFLEQQALFVSNPGTA